MEFKSDKMQYMGKVLGVPPASQSVRTVQNNRLDSQDNTPTDNPLTQEMTKEGFVPVDQRIVHHTSVVAETMYT